ncbi:hypothetical protein APA386B_718 [Acetobacter pasteurianus 386B]|nr:hypothetical protein APA386B_718 [Acetobacter pasteurianus 386B]
MATNGHLGSVKIHGATKLNFCTATACGMDA